MTKLKEADVRVLIQTLPPFDWQGTQLEKWLQVNAYVREVLAAYADGLFDVVPILIDGPEEGGRTGYGGHPDEVGCAAWAKALVPVLEEFLG